MTGEASAENIEHTLEVGLPLENYPRQSHEGASAMSGQVKGVSGRILTKKLKASYLHRSSHRLNLVVAKI